MALTTKSPGGPSKLRAGIGRSVGARLDADPRARSAQLEGVQFYYVEQFLDEAQCAALVAHIDENRRPSTLLSDRGSSSFRTSDSCDMDRWSDLVRPIDEAIAALLGLPPEHGETMQGQRYAPGQQFRTHHDYFHEGESYWPRMREAGGQRTWTAMVYLNDVAEGGATWFPQAGIRVRPRRGLLLAWNNMTVDGSPNTLTLHEGMPVVDGVKYIVTKWFREGSWLRTG
jgi:prolyl 4-hydroxylase